MMSRTSGCEKQSCPSRERDVALFHRFPFAPSAKYSGCVFAKRSANLNLTVPWQHGTKIDPSPIRIQFRIFGL